MDIKLLKKSLEFELPDLLIFEKSTLMTIEIILSDCNSHL